ncbi:MAG: universal stress protein, partial [Planctomycetes bacterium]|nr:universal stress protein [Planctomycetota bacterium]
EIVHTAIQEDADLIIMATQGRSGLEHILLGSVAEKVVRKAPCAVLIVREKAKEIVAPWGEGGGPTM